MVMAGLGFVLAFVGIIILIGSSISIAKIRSFSKFSESITGRVGNKYYHHSNNRRHYSMDINYTVNGVSYKRSVPADESEYETLKEGDPFEVYYKPNQPKKIIRGDSLSEKSLQSQRIMLIVSAAMTVIGIALILIRICIVSM